MKRRILTIALLAIALVFTASAGRAPYIMGDANPHHEFVGPSPSPTLPSGKVQP